MVKLVVAKVGVRDVRIIFALACSYFRVVHVGHDGPERPQFRNHLHMPTAPLGFFDSVEE